MTKLPVGLIRNSVWSLSVRQNLLDDFFDYEAANLGVFHVLGVLGRNHHIGDSNRLPPLIDHRDL